MIGEQGGDGPALPVTISESVFGSRKIGSIALASRCRALGASSTAGRRAWVRSRTLAGVWSGLGGELEGQFAGDSAELGGASGRWS